VRELELQPRAQFVNGGVVVMFLSPASQMCAVAAQCSTSRSNTTHPQSTTALSKRHSLCNLCLKSLQVHGAPAGIPHGAQLTQQLLALGLLVAILRLQALLGPLLLEGGGGEEQEGETPKG